jgi:hypothetical protein
MVFEAVRPGAGDAGLDSGEHSRLERLVRIADVFRHEREKNTADSPITTATSEKIEEEVKP